MPYTSPLSHPEQGARRVCYTDFESWFLASRTSQPRHLVQATPASLGRKSLPIAFGVLRQGHTSCLSTHPLSGFWVVVWLLILGSRVL